MVRILYILGWLIFSTYFFFFFLQVWCVAIVVTTKSVLFIDKYVMVEINSD